MGFSRFRLPLPDLSAHRLAWLAFALCLLPRLALVALHPHDLRYPDERGYCELAASLLNRGTYELDWADATFTNQFTSLAYPPLLPFFLYATFALAGPSVLAAKLGLTLVGAASGALLFLLAHRLYGLRAAVLATLVYGIYPLLLFVGNLVYPQTLGAFLLLACVLCLVSFRFDHPRAVRWAAGAGLALGSLILAIPAYAPLSPFFAIWLATRPGLASLALLRRTLFVLLMSACASAVVLPWTARNYLRHHEFILVTAAAANVFWEGHLRCFPEGFERELRPLSPVQRQEFLFRIARKQVAQHPMRAVLRVGEQFLTFFSVRDRQLVRTAYSQPIYRLIGAVFYLPMLAAVLLGLRHLVRVRPETWGIVLTILGTAAIYALFLAKIRYRLTVEPLIILLGSASLAHFTRALHGPSWRPPWGRPQAK